MQGSAGCDKDVAFFLSTVGKCWRVLSPAVPRADSHLQEPTKEAFAIV